MSSNINICSLCKKSDVLQKNELGSKVIRNTFFAVNKNLFPEDFVQAMHFCIICSHKLDLSIGFKKDYDEMCNRNNTFSPKKCFFCEQKNKNLVMLDENPNEIQDKIDVFLSSAIVRHGYKNLKSCTKCLYNLNIWLETRNILSNVMNIPTSNLVRTDDATNNNVTSVSTAVSTSRSSTRPKRSTSTKISRNNGKIIWKNYLNEKLKKFPTVDKLIEEEDLTLNVSSIESDEDKLFSALPFVEIFVNSQINKERILQNKENIIQTIVLSDSDTDESVMYKRLRGRPKPSLKKDNSPSKIIPKQIPISEKTPTIPKLTPMSKKTPTISKPTPMSKQRPKPMSKQRPKPMPKSKKKLIRVKIPIPSRLSLNKSLNNKTDSEVSSIRSESPTEVSSAGEDENLLCEKCDKSFTSKCEYLLHDLKHTKFENLIVNVRRERLNIEEMSPTTKENEVLSSPNVKRLLTKWLGENAVSDLEDEKKKDESKVDEESEENTQITKESTTENQQDEDKDVEEGTREENDEEKVEDMEADTTEGSKNETKNLANEEDSEHKNDKNSTNTDNDEKHEETSGSADSEQAACDNENQDEKEQSAEVGSENEAADKDFQRVSQKNNDEDKEDSSDSNHGSDNETETNTPTVENSNENKNDESTKNADVEIHNSNEDDKELDNEKLTAKSTGNDASNKTNNKNLDFGDDFSNSEVISPAPVMSCEDLITILETNIDSDEKNATVSETEEREEKAVNETDKRKRDSVDDDSTPKKKKVRFAEKKEVFTPDKKGVLIEKIAENDLPQDNSNDDNEEVDETGTSKTSEDTDQVLECES